MDKTKRTDYLGNFIYQNDSLQYALTGPGRTVWQNGTAKEEFFVKDHLGNARSVVDVHTYPLLTYMAGYEIASANLETLIFDQVDEIRDDRPGGTDPGDEQAGRLNGNEQDHRVGTSLLLKVMAGDKVELNVDNYYNEYMPEYDEPLNAEDLLGSIVSTLTIGDGGFEGSESHNADLVERMFSPENYILADDLMHSEAEDTKPKAFLNYILFNNKMEVVSTFTGSFQVDGEGEWKTIGTTAPLVIPEGGYLAIFESTQTAIHCTGCQLSASDIYFDHLMIRFTRGQLKEESHYYPFGLPMGDMGSAAAGFTPNRRKYQGNEYIKEVGLNWMDFHARQYDPQIGRFLSVDPLAASGGQDRFSPYAAMGNEPGSMVDPNGMQEQHWQNQTSAGIFIDPMIPAGSWMTNPLMEGTMGISSADMMTVVNIGGSGGTGQNMTMGQILNFLETAPPGSYSFIKGLIICNYGAGAGGSPDDDGGDGTADSSPGDDGGGDKNSSPNPDKPEGTMTLSQANKWAHVGNGEGVYMDFTKITLPGSVTVEKFSNSKQTIEGNKAILINFAGKDFVNPNQALVYGSITLVLIDNNTVMALPDVYNFDLKYRPQTFGRDIATIFGAGVSEFGYTTRGTAFSIYFQGYQTIQDK